MAWLLVVFLCKFDGKAKHNKDVSFPYLFLANNLQHIVSRVSRSNLKHLLGEEWIVSHEDMIRRFAANYERIGWGNVFAALVENTNSNATSPEEKFMRFNSNFTDTYRR